MTPFRRTTPAELRALVACLTGDEQWDLLVWLCRVQALRRYRRGVEGWTIHLDDGKKVREFFPPPDLAGGSETPAPLQLAPLGRGPDRRRPPDDDQGEPGVWASGPRPKHMPGFTAVYWPGLAPSVFHFVGQLQREAVRVLWEARAAGAPHVEQAEVLREARGRGIPAAGERLHNVFRSRGADHPAWGVLITRGGVTGTYTLPHEPPIGDAPDDESADDE